MFKKKKLDVFHHDLGMDDSSNVKRFDWLSELLSVSAALQKSTLPDKTIYFFLSWSKGTRILFIEIGTKF